MTIASDGLGVRGHKVNPNVYYVNRHIILSHFLTGRKLRKVDAPSARWTTCEVVRTFGFILVRVLFENKLRSTHYVTALARALEIIPISSRTIRAGGRADQHDDFGYEH
jgi:hypothetical protein